MATINVPSTVTDPNYRYTMPRIRYQVEGSGNGIKTNLMNMRDISAALKRNPEYTTKYLGIEFGSRATYHPAEGKSIFTGSFTEDFMAKALDKFIMAYVLCDQCRVPEVDLYVKGKSNLCGKCNACGHDYVLKNTDRLYSYILKNPPSGSTVQQNKDTTANKQTDEANPNTEKKRVKVRVKKAVSKPEKEVVPGSDKWNVALRRLINLHSTDDSPATLIAEARTLQITLGTSAGDREAMLMAALLLPKSAAEDDATIDRITVTVDQFNAIQQYFKNKNFQDLLQGLETFSYYYLVKDTFAKTFPLLVKSMYDNVLVDDGDILEFYEGEHTHEAHADCVVAIQPLLSWLAKDDASYYSDDDEQ